AKDAGNWEKDNTAVYSENCGGYVEPMTYVPDDNFEQALIDLGWDSGELDDSVATIQISQLTNLYIRDRGITDLTGIEDFVALEYFYLDGNELTELPIQNNVNLINLSCSSNQLTTINLQNLIKLEVLHCNNNLLTAIDVSANPQLKFLSCDNNAIENLDLQNNINLSELYCSYTDISSIHFSENSKLERLSCESSKLLDIDVSMLDSMNFISVYNNELTSLDLSYNLKLEEIYCGDNQIETISLPENDLLRKIGCQQNRISDIRGILGSNIPEIGSAPVLANLTYLNVQYNNFVFADFEPNWEQLTQIDNFNYYPQNWIGIETDTTVTEGSAFNLEIAGYIPGENDQYIWYKNQTIMEDEVDEVLLFEAIEHSESGSYYCEITNSLIPNLTLHMYQTSVHVTTPMGIENNKNVQYNVYPNPASDKVYVETGLEPSMLRILNQTGNVLRVVENFTDSSLDVSFLNHGIYYIHITNENESIALKLLIK
ncbi:MAG: T9SS type A sorting domain-containing protein, partial [Prolixibacteraceae bacterium]|nr:T9SS type A sorting domain-containing protein [Prolixibacteraceae bacterium]